MLMQFRLMPLLSASIAVHIILDTQQWINLFIPHLPIVLPGIDIAVDMMALGVFLMKVDLSDAFLHVHVKEADQRLLGFQWKGCFYKFKYIPWGLSTAPEHFQEATTSMATHLWCLSLKIIICLDNILLATPDLTTTRRSCQLSPHSRSGS